MREALTPATTLAVSPATSSNTSDTTRSVPLHTASEGVPERAHGCFPLYSCIILCNTATFSSDGLSLAIADCQDTGTVLYNGLTHQMANNPPTPPPPCPSNPYFQATLGVGSVNFCTVDSGGTFFNWSYYVPCVLSNTLVLRCMMFIFCVKEADSGMMDFVAYFNPPSPFRSPELLERAGTFCRNVVIL